jgi:aminoglycoside phosphotransferase (APT) family kinase protein
VTFQTPDAGELDAGRVADELLRLLRTEPGMRSVSFAEPPERLMGGFETLIYAFRLSDAAAHLAGPLVLRLLAEPGGTRQAAKEAVFQNAVAGAGYPAPRVLIAGGQRSIGERAFNVMERVHGHSMMEDLFAGLAAWPEVADLLAQTHADLHAMPSDLIANAIREAGIPPRTVSLAGQLDNLQRYVADDALAHLGPCVAWLFGKRPVERDQLVVCHGDFHPGNVMVDIGKVTGVLDWSGAQLADPEHDIAASLVLVSVAAPELASDVPPEAFEAFALGYLESYSRRRTVDPERVRYYRAYRAIRAFLRGSAARTPGVDPGLLPRDQYPWAAEGVVRRLAGVIQQTTGIAVPLPPGVGPA